MQILYFLLTNTSTFSSFTRNRELFPCSNCKWMNNRVDRQRRKTRDRVRKWKTYVSLLCRRLPNSTQDIRILITSDFSRMCNKWIASFCEQWAFEASQNRSSPSVIAMTKPVTTVFSGLWQHGVLEHSGNVIWHAARAQSSGEDLVYFAKCTQ